MMNMKVYTAVVLCLFFLLTAVFLWQGAAAWRLASGLAEQKERRLKRRQALLIMAPGAMFFFAALHILFPAGWFFDIVALIGTIAVAFAIGDGLKRNMDLHGGN